MVASDDRRSRDLRADLRSVGPRQAAGVCEISRCDLTIRLEGIAVLTSNASLKGHGFSRAETYPNTTGFSPGELLLDCPRFINVGEAHAASRSMQGAHCLLIFNACSERLRKQAPLSLRIVQRR